MAIESAVLLRRFARNACLILVVGLLVCVAATAQLPVKAPVPVTVGSVLSFDHGGTGPWSQITSVKVAHNGSVLFLDSPLSNLYQLAPGASAPTLVVGPASAGGSDGSTLDTKGQWWNWTIALDADDTLYITDRWGTIHFFRVPYDKTLKTWSFSSASNWTNGPKVTVGTTTTPIQPKDLTIGDDGTFYVSWESSSEIDKFTVDASGNASPATPVITGLKNKGSIIAVDHAGNLFLVEAPTQTASDRVPGVYEIPVTATLPLTGDGKGSLEQSGKMIRIDDPAAGFIFKGVSFDAAGNLYLATSNDAGSYGSYVNMLLMVPNEGTPTSPNLVWNDAVQIAPVPSGFPVAVDPRGYIWIPDGVQGTNWAPYGTLASTCIASGPQSGSGCSTSGMILWAPGSADLGSSPVKTAGTAQTVYYGFSKPTTPASVALASPGSSNFTITGNPNADPSVTPAVPPCTAGTAYPAFSAQNSGIADNSWCAVYLQLNPQATGSISGELQLLDSSNKVIAGSNAYLKGIGEGPAISVVSPPLVQPFALGLQAPQQVAVDPLGNSYVADSTLGTVEMYPPGQTSTVVGTAFGTNLTAPTGVAVDGAGDLYIGDSGKLIEIPAINGALATNSQTTLLTGLGNHLALAADGAGNVFVADKDNKQVVKVSNPETGLVLQGQPLNKMGSSVTFTGPSAIATDNSGNVWVADGSNLWELTQRGGATEITSSLHAPVTGLAVDPSGSVFVVDARGLVWIPYQASSGGLNPNGLVAMLSTLGNNAAPLSVALDGLQNAYVTYGSGATAGLSQVGSSGSINWGQIVPNLQNEQELQLFNLGNSSLTLSDFTGDLFTGANAGDYLVGTASDSPSCSASTSLLPGEGCYFDVALTPSIPSGTDSAALAILSNATNAPSLNVALTANVVPDLRSATTTSIAITPASGVVYPGSVSIAVTVSAVNAADGTPAGTVTLNLTGQSVQTAQLNNGVATFTYSNLIGGAKSVRATYGGDGVAGTPPDFAGSASKTSFIVATATPAVVVSAPSGDPKYITVWQGNTYLGFGVDNKINMSVTSTVGTPSGTVRFLVNGNPVDAAQPTLSLDGNGNATFSTANLPLGVYNISAVYSGDVNYASVTYAVPAFQVIAGSVQITSSPSTLTLTAGVSGKTTLSLKPLVGFSQDVGLQCVTATLPQYSECTFAFDPTNNGLVKVGKTTAPTTIEVTISTNVPVNGATSSYTARPVPWSLAGIFGLGLAGLIAGRKRWNRYLTGVGIAVMLSGMIMSVTACTNAGYSTTPPAPKVTTPAGTYQVQIITVNAVTGIQNSLTTPLFTLPTTVNAK
jgi:hypothetical protein